MKCPIDDIAVLVKGMASDFLANDADRRDILDHIASLALQATLRCVREKLGANLSG